MQPEEQFKRQASDMDISFPKKKVHLDPFAQLEQDYLQAKEPQNIEKESVKQTPLKNIQIQKIIHQGEEYLHCEYMPVQSQRICEKKVQNENGLLNDILKRISVPETVICSFYSRDNRTDILNVSLGYCQKESKKILFICPRASSRQRYKLFRSKYKKVTLWEDEKILKDQSHLILILALEQLRTIIFSNLDYLGTFHLVFFEGENINDYDFLEEILVTLPLNLQYFLLINPFQNIEEYSLWLASLRVRPVHLFSSTKTEKKPSIYGLSKKESGLYLLRNKEGNFLTENLGKYNEECLGPPLSKNKLNFQFQQVSKLLYSQNISPMLFYFQKKREVEEHARLLCQSFDFTTKERKNKIENIISKVFLVLEDQDKNSKIMDSFKSILLRGIGLIHCGLLPILNQLVELLVQERLLTVIVSNKKRHFFTVKGLILPINSSQGQFKPLKRKDILELTHFESQNEKIIVVHSRDKLQQSTLENLFSTQEQVYNSSFQLDMYSILSYHQFQDMDGEYVIQRLFKQFQHYQLASTLNQSLQNLAKQINNDINWDNQQIIKKIDTLKKEEKEKEGRLRRISYTSEKIVPHLNVGRIVRLREGEKDWGFGIVINFHKFQKDSKLKIDDQHYFVDALVYISLNSTEEGHLEPEPQQLLYNSSLTERLKMVVLTFDINCIYQITTVKMSYLPNNLLVQANIVKIFETLKHLIQLKMNYVGIECHRREALDLKQDIKKIKSQLKDFENFEDMFQSYLKHQTLNERIIKIKDQIKKSEFLVFKKVMKGYHKYFKTMSYVEKGNLTQLGRAAACINSPFSFLLIELIRDNFFESLTHSQIAGILVAMTQSSDIKAKRNTPKVLVIKQKIQFLTQTMKKLLKLMKENKIEVDQDVYMSRLRQDHVQIARRWCSGEPLNNICQDLQVFQGYFVEIMKKLHILISQLAQAAKILKKNTFLILSETADVVHHGMVTIPSIFDF